MGIEAAVLANIAIGTAAAGTVASIYTSEKGRKQQKKANRKREQVRQAQMARESMSAVRQQRIAQSQIVQGAATQGTMGASATRGGYSAVGSLTSGNMQFMNQIDNLQMGIARNMEKASMYGAQAGAISALGNLGMQAASMMPSGTPPSTPAASSGSGYGVQGGMSGTNQSYVANGMFNNPLPPSPFGG